MKKLLLVLIIALLALPIARAEEKHLKLLAVTETEEGYRGSSADLYLEVKPGNNRVFIDTFPLTKMDTQMSTRFAKSIACDFLEIDCENYDFFYRITADSTIIGGPSAGGALAIITVAALKGLDLDETVAVTGTINSGGLIGPVGGLKSKIDAASELKLKKVLIPQGERYVEDTSIPNTKDGIARLLLKKENRTIDLVGYGEEKGLKVMEVSNLNEAVYEFTGRRIKEGAKEIQISPKYEEVMEGIAVDLCNRSKELRSGIKKVPEKYASIEESGLNLTNRGDAAFESKEYYSSASFCFGANIKYSYLLLLEKNLTKEELLGKVYSINKSIEGFENELEKRDYKTIADLQARMVVKERLLEAKDYLSEASNENLTEDMIYDIAFANERVRSAETWAMFLDTSGKEFNFDKDALRDSCINKIAEAEERYQYVNLFIPNSLESARKGIARSKEDLKNGDYELCLFKASEAKAEANGVLSLMDAKDDAMVKGILNQKLKVIKENIAEERGSGAFPIVGYSYYEYASELKDTDVYSALLYAEYALELSNLDIYFKESGPATHATAAKGKVYIDKKVIFVLLYGIVVGYVISLVFKRGRR